MADEAAKVEGTQVQAAKAQPAAGSGSGVSGVEDGTHPGWAPGAYEQFKAARSRVGEFEAKLTAKDAELATATSARTQAERALEAERAARLQDRVFIKAAVTSPNFDDPDVQDFVREQYDKYRARTGDKAEAFDKWFASDAARKSPLLAPHFAAGAAAAAGAGAGATGQGAQGGQGQTAATAQAALVEAAKAAETAAANSARLPNVNGGADTTQAVSPANFTAEQIAKMSRAEFALHEAAIRKALEARLGVSLGKGRKA